MLKKIYLFLFAIFCLGIVCSPCYADYSGLSPQGKKTVENFQKMYGLSSPEEAYGLLSSIQSAGVSMYNNWDPDTQAWTAMTGGDTYSDRRKAAGKNMFGGEMVGGKYLDQLLNEGKMDDIRMCIEETDSLLNTMEDCANDGDDGAKKAIEAAKATGVWGQMRSVANAMWNNSDLQRDENGNLIPVLDENGNRVCSSCYQRSSAVIQEFASQFQLGSALVGDDKIFVRQLVQYAQDGGCWFCPVFYKSGNDGIYGAVNNLATHVYNELNDDFLGLMGVGILFLILFKVGKMVTQLQEVDVMQFLNDLFKPLGRAMLASSFLIYGTFAGGDSVFALITNPVLDMSLRLGEEIMTTTLDNVQVIKSEIAVVDNMMQSKIQPNWAPINSIAEAEVSGGTNTAMGESPGLMMYTWMQSVASSFPVGIALGATFIEVGLDNFFSNGGFAMFLSGIILWLGFWVIYLTFPFKLIDTFVRMSFVFALMPLWIVLWVFPATQGYTKKAWEMFLSCALFFVVMSVMVGLVMMLINNIVPSDIHDELFRNLREGYNDKAAELASFGSGICMNAIAFTAMSFSILSSAGPLANSFVGGGGGIQTNVGAGTAVSIAKGAAVTTAVGRGAAKLGWATGAGAVSLGQKLFGGKGAAAASAGASTLGHFTPSGNAAGASNGGSSGSDSGNGGGSAENNGSSGNETNTGNNSTAEQTSGTNTAANANPSGTSGQGSGSAQQTASGSSGQGSGSTHGAGGSQQAASESGASAGATAAANTASLTPEQKEALERLSHKDDAPSAFTKLGEDMRRVGSLMAAKNPDEFRQQLAAQTWSTDAKKMEDFATSMYQNRNLPTMAEGDVKRMLNDYAKNVAGSDPSGTMRSLMEPMAQTSSNAPDRFESLSSQLSKLASDVAGMKGKSNA